MIERTQRRLRQARFFYQHLVNPRHSTQGDPEAFGFYVSAFIQAARSITWTLGNEEPDKWKAWEPKWKAGRTAEEQKLLNITNKLRIDETKKGGATLTKEVEEVALEALVEAIPSSQGPGVAGAVNLVAASGKITIQVPIPFHYFEDETKKQEVTALCQRYLNFLEKMVKDFCEDNHD
jgi:hypothetical protein